METPKTVNQVEIAKANAESKGFKVVQDSEDFIGFRKSDWVYYWFRVLNMSDGNVWLVFDHIYSQTNGKTSRSLTRGYKMNKDLGL